MRVRIPPGVAISTREDGQKVVEVYVATPTGISNRLQIPVTPAPSPITPAAPPASNSTFTVADANLTMSLRSHNTAAAGAAAVYVVDGVNPFPPNVRVRIQPTIGLPSPAPDPIDVTISFAFSATNSITVVIPNVPLVNNIYVIDSNQLNAMAQQIFDLVKKNNLSYPGNMTSRPLLMVPAGTIGPPVLQTNNALTITFDLGLTARPDCATPYGPGAPRAEIRPGAAVAGSKAESVRDAATVKASLAREAPDPDLPPLPRGVQAVLLPMQAQIIPPAPNPTVPPAGTTTPPPPQPPTTPPTVVPPTVVATPSTSQTHLVLPQQQQRQPMINISVPITNGRAATSLRWPLPTAGRMTRQRPRRPRLALRSPNGSGGTRDADYHVGLGMATAGTSYFGAAFASLELACSVRSSSSAVLNQRSRASAARDRCSSARARNSATRISADAIEAWIRRLSSGVGGGGEDFSCE